MDMNERKQKILAVIVEQYIETGEPIGSKGLVEKLGLSLSSATIRNEMSELSAMGYLEQPHTSSGRIPSHMG
ncbi:MAG: heat-inducible transcription repressor HrcA, partial [Eubacteriales bacterium]